jgi:predicted Zn-dependent peptidase
MIKPNMARMYDKSNMIVAGVGRKPEELSAAVARYLAGQP